MINSSQTPDFAKSTTFNSSDPLSTSTPSERGQESISADNRPTSVVNLPISLIDNPLQVIRYTANGIIALFVLFTNLMTVIAVLRSAKLQTKTNAILTSLAVADIIFAVASFDNITYTAFSSTACSFAVYKAIIFPLEKIPIFASFLHMIIVAVDRFVAIVFPLHYENLLTKFRVGCMITGSWIIAVLASMTLYAGYAYNGACVPTNLPNQVAATAVVIYVTVVGLLGCLYAKILMVARKHRVELAQYAYNNAQVN